MTKLNQSGLVAYVDIDNPVVELQDWIEANADVFADAPRKGRHWTSVYAIKPKKGAIDLGGGYIRSDVSFTINEDGTVDADEVAEAIADVHILSQYHGTYFDDLEWDDKTMTFQISVGS